MVEWTVLLGALAVLTLTLASDPDQASTASEEISQSPSPEEARELRRQEHLRLAEEEVRDLNARLARIECRRFQVLKGWLKATDHLEWSLGAGMAAPITADSRQSASPFLIPMVGWGVWNPIWGCLPPSREEMESVGLGDLHVDWAAWAHHQLFLSLGADAIVNLQGARFRPLAGIGFGYRQGGPRGAPLFAARLAAGPTFGAGGTGGSISLGLSVHAFEAMVRFERGPNASFLLLSLGVRDVHRY